MSGCRTFASSLFNTVFPDDCRVCEQPLTNVSRIPVCPSCLALPQPLKADFFCQICKTPFLDEYQLDPNGRCQACRGSSVNFDAAYAFGSYEGVLRQLIHLYKYAKVESLAGPLSRILTQAIPLTENFDLVMAMPMHWRKQWERGFNQAELLAEPVSRRYGLKLSTHLRRKRYTKAQAGLDEKERRENLKDSFRLHRPAELRGKRVLLIDDVFTTGATLRAAAGVLKAAGAARVTALTLARVDRHLFRSRESAANGQSKPTSLHHNVDLFPGEGHRAQTAGRGVK